MAFELAENEIRLVEVAGPNTRVAWAEPVERGQLGGRDFSILVKTSGVRFGLDGRFAGSIPEGIGPGPCWRWEPGQAWALAAPPPNTRRISFVRAGKITVRRNSSHRSAGQTDTPS